MLLFVTCVATNNLTNHLENRMIKGTLVNDDRFAYTVAVLDNSNNQVCAGTVLTGQAVLSSDVCLTNTDSNYKVVAGTRVIGTGGNEYPVDRIARQESVKFKLAILILKGYITGAKAIELPQQTPEFGYNTFALGWGSDNVTKFTISLPSLP